MKIPFNKPYMTGNELNYIAEAHANSMLAGDGPFTKRCHEWLECKTGTHKALLTHSCTAALEMAALLLDIKPGDEVIMPSYTFVSTANAFVLRGGVPVFVDIRPDTLNIDERLIEAAITPRTRVIVPVHYAGVACEMDTIMDIAHRHDLAVVEDAAQGVMSTYKGRALGTFGDFGCYSFHETKNIISGEGGALLINNKKYAERAEIIREKGTDRSRFFRGQVDKYTWQDYGSSFLPGELTAAFLLAQLEQAEKITRLRKSIWDIYDVGFKSLEEDHLLQRAKVPEDRTSNAHMYYVMLNKGSDRNGLINYLSSKGMSAIFHYVPLHTSPAAMRYARVCNNMEFTEELSSRIIRLPMWIGLEYSQQINIVNEFRFFLNK